MEINKDQYVPSGELTDPFRKRQQSKNTFSSMLDAERSKAETQAARDEILGNQARPDNSENKEDFEFIREHGLRAYAEKIHEEKVEELREKLLAAMGLTEESLAELPADQRLAIEKMIAQEIKKRMAADSMTSGDTVAGASNTNQSAMGHTDKDNLLAAQIVSGETGAVIGEAIVEASEGENTDERHLSDDDNG
jgi:hypothetical protein